MSEASASNVELAKAYDLVENTFRETPTLQVAKYLNSKPPKFLRGFPFGPPHEMLLSVLVNLALSTHRCVELEFLRLVALKQLNQHFKAESISEADQAQYLEILDFVNFGINEYVMALKQGEVSGEEGAFELRAKGLNNAAKLSQSMKDWCKAIQ